MTLCSALQLSALLERLRDLPGDYLLAEVIKYSCVNERGLSLACTVYLQVLFGLIFQLPTPPHCLVYYSSLIIELCKIRAATFPLVVQRGNGV